MRPLVLPCCPGSVAAWRSRECPIERLFARPPKAGALEVLLIVNPTEDLPGTEEEARAVTRILEQSKDRVKLTVLTGQSATRTAVQAALAQADVLHYCGHAFFDGPGRDQSGLILAGHRAADAGGPGEDPFAAARGVRECL